MIERRIARRAAFLWLGVRGVSMLFLVLAGGSPLKLNFKGFLILTVVAGYVTWITVRNNNEDLMLANLGTKVWAVAALCVAPAVILEGLLQIILSVG